jgi:anti-sigma-K factor RskA
MTRAPHDEPNEEPNDGPELDELRSALDELSLVVPALGANPDVDARLTAVRGRLMSRVRGERSRATSSLWLVGALAASFVAAAILWRKDLTLGRELADTRAAVVTTRAALDSATTALDSAKRQLALVTDSSVAVVSLAASGAKAASALMFWDRASNTWSMYARNLPTPPSGRTYELWLITNDGKKIPAGTFDPTPHGTAHVEAKYALDRDNLAAVAVTEEPAGGVEVATGPVVIVGSPLKPAH